ncbi:hypothetical protein F5B20DRAFT_315608 [Whalleya microplaca]|nr:hypothetical protein F5B20DRAFT_315608 [Whalleya microplaca]
MPPNFETFRNFSTRFDRYRRRPTRGQDSNGDNSTAQQQPDQAQPSDTVPRSGPSQSFISKHSSIQQAPAMTHSAGQKAFSQPSRQQPRSSNTIASSSMADAIPSGPQDAFANANAEAQQVHQLALTTHHKGKAQADQLASGSKSNPIDLTQSTSNFVDFTGSSDPHNLYKAPALYAPSTAASGSTGSKVPTGTVPPSQSHRKKFDILRDGTTGFVPPPGFPPLAPFTASSIPGPPTNRYAVYDPQHHIPGQGVGSLDTSGDEAYALALQSEWNEQILTANPSNEPGHGAGHEPGPSSDSQPAGLFADAFQYASGLYTWGGNHLDSAPSVIQPFGSSSQTNWWLKAEAELTGVESDGHEWATSESSSDSEKSMEDIAFTTAVSEELTPLRQFGHTSLERACAGCHKKINLGPKSIPNMTRRWVTRTGSVVLASLCQNHTCKANTCLGCGKLIPTFAKKHAVRLVAISGKQLTVEWCCEEGRLFALWALACGWEIQESRHRFMSTVNKARKRGPPKIVVSSQGSPMRNNQPANAKGVGYGSERPNFSPFTYSKRIAAPTAQPIIKKRDPREELAREAYFRILAVLLPSYELENDFDMDPPRFLTSLLSRSPLVEQTAMMLSNDAIDEISGKYHLYDGMLEFVYTLGSHTATAKLVYSDRNIYHAKGGSLLDVCFDDPKGKGKITVKDTGKSLATLLSNLATQSQTVLRHAKGNANEFNNKEGQNLLALSQRLSDISALHAINMQRFRTEMEINEDGGNTIDFSQWHLENCVSDTPDEAILSNFHFAQEAVGAASHAPPRGRMKRLITELSTLQTSLPEGIFVRHGSSRLDVMKVLIIGPKGTPYEHGFFEFDLYCGLDYPNSPPKMQFRTTNCGQTRFNPNLYEDGKICLSLLGTWSGEPWRANQSTVLQVLISIQSMILCEQPWYNEPGRENCENKTQSVRYNNEVRSWTLQYALLPWIHATRAPTRANGSATGPVANAGINVEALGVNMAPVWCETANLYLRANAKEIAESAMQANLKSKNAMLHTACQTTCAELRNKGYLS